jgi:secondary thiamine-phosphate synthase enzyme
MRQGIGEFETTTRGPGLIEITRRVLDLAADTPVETGLLTVYCRHTSCSLLIQENADPDVLRDLHDAFARLAPHDPSRYRHGAEGPDDMPAHIRAALTQSSLSIPIAGGRPVLGTWQGIYLFEHRDRPHVRRIVVHVIGA